MLWWSVRLLSRWLERATSPPTSAEPQKRVSNERDTCQADDRICPATPPSPNVFADVVPIFEETIKLEIKIVALVQFIVDLASLYERIHNINIRRWYSLLRQFRYLLRLPGFALPFPVLNLSRVPVT